MLLTVLRKLVSWILSDLLLSVARRWFAGDLSLQKLADKVLASLPRFSGKTGDKAKNKTLS